MQNEYRPPVWPWVAGIGFILFLWLLSTMVKVGTGQVGIVTSFGKVTGRQMNEGLNFKAPYPFERVTKYNVRVQKEQAEAAAASQDLQDVSTTLVVNYHLDRSRIAGLHKTVGPDYQEKLIDPAIQESVKSTTAKFPIAELITKRGELKDDSVKVLKARLEGRGIIVDDISITNIGFSRSFTQAIEAKQVAEQQAQQAQFNLQKANLDARANQVQTAALTDAILRQQAIAKWNGVLPTTVAGPDNILGLPVK